MNHRPRHQQRTSRSSRRSYQLAGLALLGLLSLGATHFSSATFTARSTTGLSSVSAATDWTPPVVAIASPPAAIRGTTPVTATAGDVDSGVKNVAIQYQPDQGNGWTTICTQSSPPYTCAWDTASLSSGTYDLRAEATDLAGNTAASTTARTLVDNTAPTVSMTDPGTPLSGTRTFAATVSDAHSGVAQVAIEYSTGTTYTTLCATTSSAWSCSFDTTKLANGTYTFRAVATDRVGNTTTSTAVAARVVANVASTVTLAAPAEALRGTVTLTASATSTGPITHVAIQRSPAGAAAWTTICTDAFAPYSCSFDTSAVADGGYDLRAVLTDSSGATTVSEPVSGRVVDNTAPTGYDVQAVNHTGTVGRIDTGDVMTLTYSERVNLSSILAGWDGGAVPITTTITPGLPTTDSITFSKSGSQLNLGEVELKEDFVAGNSVNLNATMTASTVIIDGVSRTVVSIRVDSNGGVKTARSAASMVWTPSASVTDLAGNAVLHSPVTETGPVDQDF